MNGVARRALIAAAFGLGLVFATAPVRADIKVIGGSGFDIADPGAMILWRSAREANSLMELETFFAAGAHGQPVPGHLWPGLVRAAANAAADEAEGTDLAATLSGEQADTEQAALAGGLISGTALVPDPAPAQACDWLAAHPDDPAKFGPAVEWDALVASEAIVECQRAVHLFPNSARLRFQLARAYEKADVLDVAIRLYRLAAESGSSSAMLNLGLMYHAGRGLPRDPEAAIELYRQAAELGHPGAMYSLGLVRARGLGAEKDTAKAVTWFEKAAELGLARAMYSLGVLYAGSGAVEADTDKAVDFFRRAAEAGHFAAMNKMGMAYVSGSGVETKDFRIAVNWYARAAKRENLPAMYNLGVMMSRGWGVPKDNEQANKWFRRAGLAGYERALEKLGDLAEIQLMLTNLGFDTGPIDGLMGPQTRETISEFQKKHGIKVDGEPSPELVMALLEAMGPVEADEESATAALQSGERAEGAANGDETGDPADGSVADLNSDNVEPSPSTAEAKPAGNPKATVE